MLIRIIVLLLIIIGCDIIVPTIVKKIHKQAATCETPESFTIVIPRFVFWLGIVGSNLCVLGLLVLPIFDDPDWIFYVSSCLLLLLCLYLIIKTVTFRVVVKGDLITVYSALRRPYSFRFHEIEFVKREVKQTNYGPRERMIIKAKDKKRVIVDSAEVSYFLMLDKIKNEVSNDLRTGF